MARCGSASEAPSSMKMALLIFLLLLSSEPPGTVSCVWIKHSEHCCDKDIKKCINGAEGVDYVAAEDSLLQKTRTLTPWLASEVRYVMLTVEF